MTQVDTKYKITAAQYEKIAVIAKAAADEMISRLYLVALQPKRIIDVGCATGYTTTLLKALYPTADILGLDFSENLLQAAPKNLSFFINSLTHSLPILTHSTDMLIANLVLPWQKNWASVLTEWRRVLRPEGLLMITTLGPDTLKEWPRKDAIQPHFLDMHNLGDGLIEAGFADPIVDVEQIILSYRDQQKLLDELQMTNMIKPDEPLAQTDLQVTFEIVFGHAWAALPRESSQTVNISLESLRRQVLSKL